MTIIISRKESEKRIQVLKNTLKKHMNDNRINSAHVDYSIVLDEEEYTQEDECTESIEDSHNENHLHTILEFFGYIVDGEGNAYSSVDDYLQFNIN